VAAVRQINEDEHHLFTIIYRRQPIKCHAYASKNLTMHFMKRHTSLV
jgi:hypothetical protein